MSTVAVMTLAHDVTGSGPALLLVHSTVCDRRMWDPQVPALTAAGYQVIRCDLRGYGDSPMPDGPYDNAQDVADLLGELGVTRLAVVGASGGGQVALEFATRWPERIRALALFCTALRGHEPSTALRKFGAEEDALLEAGDVAGATDLNVELWLGPEADEATREKVRQMQRHAFEVQLAAEDIAPATDESGSPAESRSPAESGPTTKTGPTAESGPLTEESGPTPAAGSTGVSDQPATEQNGAEAAPAPAPGEASALGSVTAPVLLISGAHDLPDFRDIAAQLAGQLPQARHMHLDWAGHLPNMERPDLMNPLLVSFLDEAASVR